MTNFADARLYEAATNLGAGVSDTHAMSSAAELSNHVWEMGRDAYSNRNATDTTTNHQKLLLKRDEAGRVIEIDRGSKTETISYSGDGNEVKGIHYQDPNAKNSIDMDSRLTKVADGKYEVPSDGLISYADETVTMDKNGTLITKQADGTTTRENPDGTWHKDLNRSEERAVNSMISAITNGDMQAFADDVGKLQNQPAEMQKVLDETGNRLHEVTGMSFDIFNLSSEDTGHPGNEVTISASEAAGKSFQVSVPLDNPDAAHGRYYDLSDHQNPIEHDVAVRDALHKMFAQNWS